MTAARAPRGSGTGRTTRASGRCRTLAVGTVRRNRTRRAVAARARRPRLQRPTCRSHPARSRRPRSVRSTPRATGTTTLWWAASTASRLGPYGVERHELGDVPQHRQPGRHVRQCRGHRCVQQLVFRRQRLDGDTGHRHRPARCPQVVEVELEPTDPADERAVQVEFATEGVEHRDRLREAAVEARPQLVRPPSIAGFRGQHTDDVGQLLGSDQQIDVVEVALLRILVDRVRQRRSLEHPMVEEVRLEHLDDPAQLSSRGGVAVAPMARSSALSSSRCSTVAGTAPSCTAASSRNTKRSRRQRETSSSHSSSPSGAVGRRTSTSTSP